MILGPLFRSLLADASSQSTATLNPRARSAVALANRFKLCRHRGLFCPLSRSEGQLPSMFARAPHSRRHRQIISGAPIQQEEQ